MISRKFLLLLRLLVAVAGGVAIPTQTATAQQQVTLTVSAAISLKEALDKVGRVYEQRYPGVKIAFNYGSSGTLLHQIEQGAPVDIFFSAAAKQMDALQSAGLIDIPTRRDVVANQLVLVVPASSNALREFSDLSLPVVKIIALGEPSTVPAGMYARQTLEHLGLLVATEKKIILAKDVRAVRTYVETGNADAGFIYRTDAGGSSKIRVVATAPVGSHDLIVYPAAVVKQSKHQAAARSFLEFLVGPDARSIFTKFGFSTPPESSERN